MIKATRGYIDGIATALTQNTDIKLQESDEGWFTDVKTKTLNYVASDLTQLPAFVAKGLILHEVGHLKYTKSDKESHIAKDNPAMQDIYNVLEDVRIEEKLMQDYGDYAIEGIAENNEYHSLGDMDKKAFLSQNKLNQFLKIFLTLSNFQNIHYSSTANQKAFNHLWNMTTDDVREKINQLWSGMDNEAKRIAKTTQEIKDFADGTLYPHLKEWIDEANKNPQPVKCRGDDQVGVTPSLQGNGKNIAKIPLDEELEQLLSPYINTLSRRLADILKERMSTRYTGNHLSGKLLSKNAYKVVADEHRIFSRKNNPNKPHYVVTMALDDSGSMSGEKHANSYLAAYLLQGACLKLGFPIKIIKFGTHASIIPKLRDYKDKYTGSGNDESEVIALLKTKTDPNDDNLVFIVTDGGCGYDVRPDVDKFVRDGYIIAAVAVAMSEKNNKEDVEQLRHNYPYVALAPQVEQLPGIMINLMRQFIHR